MIKEVYISIFISRSLNNAILFRIGCNIIDIIPFKNEFLIGLPSIRRDIEYRLLFCCRGVKIRSVLLCSQDNDILHRGKHQTQFLVRTWIESMVSLFVQIHKVVFGSPFHIIILSFFDFFSFLGFFVFFIIFSFKETRG